MRSVKTDSVLKKLEERVLFYANEMGRQLPEMRFFILDRLEFASLLEKHVYPTSPSNIWEGKRMVNRKLRIESGQESGIYYEVVQTGDPSYAYLNNTNSPMMQASVMAHVVGHCEFSEINVLKDSNKDRTEYVMYLVKKVEEGRVRMGEKNYREYWNAAESALPLIAPHSQFNLDRSIEGELSHHSDIEENEFDRTEKEALRPFSYTLDRFLNVPGEKQNWETELIKKTQQEQINRSGYRLYAPCQDIMGFLRRYAPSSKAEQHVLDYMYTSHATHDFVIRTQIMNEGWAMYWEKQIMLKLFEERAVNGIIDYSKTFSGVCKPRPFYMRNPYHVGYHLWNHIKEMVEKGKISLEYQEETDLETKEKWNKKSKRKAHDYMNYLVKTITDYEFIRRFLTPELIADFRLNMIPKAHLKSLNIQKDDIINETDYWFWIRPEPVKSEMLNFFSHFYRPRIYVIDSDFEEGGLLLFHRDDKQRLRSEWIKPTLKNLNLIWKGPTAIITNGVLYKYSAGAYTEKEITKVTFEEILERMQKYEKPIKTN